MTTPRLLAALLILSVATPAARADVLVVDNTGGGDFLTLSAAVAAAAPGDTLLVRAGTYTEAEPVVVDGVPLSIVGEPGGFSPVVVITPGLVVRGLQANERVLLQNLAVIGAPSTSGSAAGPALLLENNNSHVRVQACTFAGGYGASNANPDGGPGVLTNGNLSVAFISSSIGGGGGQHSPSLAVKTGHGGPGVRHSGGQLHLSATLATGGGGGSNIIGGWPDGGNGGAGVLHEAGTVIQVGGSSSGGDGGVAHSGGDGGAGVSFGELGLAWLLAGTQQSGGEGGSSDVGPNGVDGAPLVDPNGLATDYGGTFKGFQVSSPVREGQPGSLGLGGGSQDLAMLFVALDLHQIVMTGYQGVLMLFPTSMLGPFVLGPPANQTLPFLAPNLPAALDVLHVHVQPVYVGAQGNQLGPAGILTVLDSAF